MSIPALERLIQSNSLGRIVGLDPGGTTGACLFAGSRLVKATEVELDISDIDRFLVAYLPIDRLVLEDYRVYAQYAKAHTSSGLPTVRLIGAITLWCGQHNIPITFQMASMAKGFVTNEKLRTWGLYQVGMKHANDAVRHAVYYLIFGPAKSKYKAGHGVG